MTIPGSRELAAEVARLAGESRALKSDAAGPGAEEPGAYEDACTRLLHLLRTLIGMKVAWISEFVGVEQVFRMVDTAPGERGPDVGATTPLSDAYCSRVLAGAMPAVIPNVRDDPTAVWLDLTFAMQIGSYLGVPLHGPDGAPTGMLCAISDTPTPDLDEQDLATARLVAQVIDDLSQRAVSEARGRRERRMLGDQLTAMCRGHGRRSVLHPIVDIRTGDAVAAEGLTRFTDNRRTPSGWFAAAHTAGLGSDLEVAAARDALTRLDDTAAPPAIAVNVSPAVAANRIEEVLDGVDPARVVLELTEYAPVHDYAALTEALAPSRAAGMRIAIDDVGAGFASMSHVLRLRPDLVKIDMTLVRDIDADPIRQALAGALVRFAEATGAAVVAEGVETVAELTALDSLGVPLAQGYLFGTPSAHPMLRGLPHCAPSGAGAQAKGRSRPSTAVG